MVLGSKSQVLGLQSTLMMVSEVAEEEVCAARVHRFTWNLAF